MEGKKQGEAKRTYQEIQREKQGEAKGTYRGIQEEKQGETKSLPKRLGEKTKAAQTIQQTKRKKRLAE